MKPSISEHPDLGDRPTMELCGAERDGRRCIRDRGHEGTHEALTTAAVHTWLDGTVVQTEH